MFIKKKQRESIFSQEICVHSAGVSGSIKYCTTQ
jgi:hypothetical protein